MSAERKAKKIPFIEILIGRFEEYSQKELYSMIMCGEIKVDGETVRDARRAINPESEIIITSRRWVSRGGEKLNHALENWKIDAADRVVLDAGASTGGFTDCLLQRGAARVHAVDVGYNQLDYSLRTDSRVNVLERTNIMAVEELQPVPEFAVADLSFRSITGAASHILKLTAENLLIALIKPQFELQAAEGFDGVIKDPDILHEVLRNTAVSLQDEGVEITAVLESPIKGGKGNTEFLVRLIMADDRKNFSNSGLIDSYLASFKSEM